MEDSTKQCNICLTTETPKWYSSTESGKFLCKKDYLKIYYAKHKDKVNKERRDKFKFDEEYRLKIKQQNKKSYIKQNPEIRAEKRHEKYIRHKTSGHLQEYREKNRDKILEYKNIYRERSKENIKLTAKKHYCKNKENILKDMSEYRKTINYWWSQLNSNSERRNTIVRLTFDEYKKIRQQTCHYCGKQPELTGIGLDRRDNNNRVYDMANAVPCCHFCNNIKGDILTEQEMLTVSSALQEEKEGNATKYLKYVKHPITLWDYDKVKRDRSQDGFLKLILSAKKRELAVTLTKQMYDTLTKNKLCTYCCGVLSKTGHNLDRIDSKIKEYNEENCTACCPNCNYIKCDLLTADQMFVAIGALKFFRLASRFGL